MKPKSRPSKQALAGTQVLQPISQKVHYKKGRSAKTAPPAGRPKPDSFKKGPAGAPELRKNLRKRDTVLPMPVPRPVEAQDHAQRVAAHRAQLDEIHAVYRQSTADVFSDPGSLAKKKSCIRGNMRQLAKVLGDWHCTALELLEEGQQAALLEMLDFKGGRWLN